MGSEVSKMQGLIEDLKSGDFRHVYLLYGEEPYLMQQYCGRLIRALLPDDAGMNLNTFEGDKTQEGAIIDQGETLPFFAERRVIRVDRSGLFKGTAELLPDYIKELPEYLYLVFTEDEVDKRSRMFKAVSAAGRCVSFPVQTPATLSAWVLKMLGKEGLKIRRQDMDYLLERTGSDMNRVALEVDKLVHYCAGKDAVTRDDISAVVTQLPEDRVFDMVRALTAHDRKKAMDLYADLVSLKEPPMRTLYLISLEYNRLLMVKELAEAGAGDAEIAKKAGMPPFAVRRTKSLAARYEKKQLRKVLELCVGADEDIKSGRMSDRLAVELLLVQLS